MLMEAAMTPRDMFRVMMKTIGLVAILYGTVSLLFQIATLIYMDAFVANGPMGQFMQGSELYGVYILAILSALIWVLVGCHLFFGGRWILDMAFPYKPNRCRECGYDMFGVKGDVCPECAATKLKEPDPTDSIEIEDLPSTY